jgi:hypothetical protein
MLAIIFLLLTTATGYLLTRHFFPSLSLSASLAAGWIIGILLSTGLLLLSIFLLGYEVGIIAAAVFCVVLCWILLVKAKVKLFIAQKFSLTFALFLLVWGILFFSLFFRSSLRQTSEGYYTAPYTYGDIALHATMINYFSEQNVFSLQHPLFSQNVIRYPFLINFHSAILVRLGLPIQFTFLAVGMATMLAILALMFEITTKLSKHQAVPWIASSLYFLNGGFGWLLLRNTITWPNASSILAKLPFDYTNIQAEQLFWTNITTTHILPQRGFMVGLAVALLCLCLLQESWRAKKLDILQLVCIASIIGVTTLFHSHSFILLTVLYLWLIGWALYYQKLELKAAVLSLLPIVIFGGAQLFYIFEGNHHSFVQLQLGWKAGSNFLTFWLWNMGLDLAVLATSLSVFFAKHKKQSFIQLLLLPSLGVYILCNIFIFQPNDWDNMKFMSLGFLAPCLMTAVILGEAMNSLGKKLVVSIFIIFATVSGALSVMYVLQNNWLLSSQKDIALADEIKKITSSDSLFLTGEQHNHPVPMLAGRPIVLGYKGWLWTHGVEYQTLDQQVKEIYSGSPKAAINIQQLGIQYVFIGNPERTSLVVSDNYFAEHFPIVLQKEDVTIYKVQ